MRFIQILNVTAEKLLPHKMNMNFKHPKLILNRTFVPDKKSDTTQLKRNNTLLAKILHCIPKS